MGTPNKSPMLEPLKTFLAFTRLARPPACWMGQWTEGFWWSAAHRDRCGYGWERPGRRGCRSRPPFDYRGNVTSWRIKLENARLPTGLEAHWVLGWPVKKLFPVQMTSNLPWPASRSQSAEAPRNPAPPRSNQPQRRFCAASCSCLSPPSIQGCRRRTRKLATNPLPNGPDP